MGLKANELRIGNLINDEQTTHIVVGVDNYYIKSYWLKDEEKETLYETPIKNIKPIPLTEEWLLKFGIENKYGCFLLSTNRGTIQIEEDLAEISSVITHNGFMAPCKYVHQLQNLFYSICGKELLLKHV